MCPRFFVSAMAMWLLASPALALSVTNLDTVPHQVRFESAGGADTRTLAPNQTVRFEAMPNGTLSLVTSPDPRQGGTVNADGLLGQYLGNGRDQGISADIMDDYTIWPGGKLQLQRRMKRYGRY